MKSAFQLQPMVLAVSGALAVMGNPVLAQVFDSNSAAVRQAYVGAATQEKKDAALAGLGLLAKQVRQSGSSTISLPPISSAFSTGPIAFGFDVVTVNLLPFLPFITLQQPVPVATFIQAASDNDLGAPGAPVTLNNGFLQTLASFNTARNFTIGAFGGTIDTQSFNLGISGNINATGTLTKTGTGTLTLTGNNSWNAGILNMRGVIEGNTGSLQTSIVNNGLVRFNQSHDGVYRGVISSDGGFVEKAGAGRLTLTETQTYTNGTTSILGGTLALASNGALPLAYAPALHISTGATFDISGSAVQSHAVGALSGAGNIVLGGNSLSSGSFLSTNAYADTTYSGSISGSGGFTKAGGGTLTLAGVNSYSGATRIFDSKVALAGEGRLNPVSVIQMSRGTFEISAANSNRDVGSLGGSGSVILGANTLIVGNANIDDQFEGTISGSGGFTKNGTGKLTLTGANTYTGITTINQGILAAHARSISDRVVNNGTLNFVSLSTDDFSLAYGGSISGTGNVNKSIGTLTLTGVNSYTGTTTISGGWLGLAGQGRLSSLGNVSINSGTFDISGADGGREVGSIQGNGTINLGANTLTVGVNNTNQYYSGEISGSGGLTKTGSGDFTLTGLSSFTGITTINQGSLTAKTQSISERVINNATLKLTEDKGATAPFISAYSGTISGTGQLVKEGDGLIWLRGRNTYTGGTTVNSGYLIGNTDSLQGNITNNAALAFYQVDDGSYTGALSGSGTLLQFGPGELTLTGNNTYTGGTAFSGTLRVDRDANLGAASGSLVMAGGTLQIGADMTTARDIALAPAGGTFDTNGNRLTVTGNISGPGDLAKTGAGTLTLNGANTYAGVTTVNAGRLEVNGSINSNVLVAAGAELGGSGVISSNFILNRGRLARGSGIGDIRVQGNFAFDPGSVFSVKTNAAGESDRLLVATLPFKLDPLALPAPSGLVALNGGKVEVLAENGNYRRETRYNIVNAARGVSGQFAGVTSNLAFLSPSLAYDTNNVYLTLARNDINYAAVAQSPNQSAVAESLTRVSAVTTGDAVTVANAIDGLSAAQAQAAFNSIGAAGLTAVRQVGAVNMRTVSQNLIARLGEVESSNALATAAGIAGRAVQLAFDAGTRSDAPPVYAQAGMPAGGQGLRTAAEPNNGFWLRGYGGTGRIDGDASAPGAKYNYGGTLFGYDRKLGDAVTLGVFGGYAEPRYSQDVATSSARAKTYQVGGYGRVHSGAWHVDAVASYARNDTDTSRVVTVGALNRTANGSFTGGTVSAHVETGYTLKAGAYELQPLAALSWVRQSQNAYSESGAGALNLVLPDQTQESLRSSLGLRTLRPFQAGAVQAVIEARVAWSHEFNNTRSINARLAGDPAAAVFTVSGPSLPRDSAVVGVGVAAQAARNLRLYADVNGEFNGRVRAGALSVGLRYQW